MRRRIECSTARIEATRLERSKYQNEKYDQDFEIALLNIVHPI